VNVLTYLLTPYSQFCCPDITAKTRYVSAALSRLFKQVLEAARRGAVGVVVYFDAEDGASDTDDGPGLPDWAAVHGSLYRRGDPTTPGEPSTGNWLDTEFDEKFNSSTRLLSIPSYC